MMMMIYVIRIQNKNLRTVKTLNFCEQKRQQQQLLCSWEQKRQKFDNCDNAHWVRYTNGRHRRRNWSLTMRCFFWRKLPARMLLRVFATRTKWSDMQLLIENVLAHPNTKMKSKAHTDTLHNSKKLPSVLKSISVNKNATKWMNGRLHWEPNRFGDTPLVDYTFVLRM